MNSSSTTQRQRPPVAQEEQPHTRLRDGIRKPHVYTDGTIRYGMIASTGEPSNLTKALTYSNWKSAMDTEFDTLVRNKT
jgi:hypothetical protein